MMQFSSHSTISAIAPSAQSRELARTYVDWCSGHGFTEQAVSVDDLLDPERLEVPTLSPFFVPDDYLAGIGNGGPRQINPYLHYFETGWGSDPGFSRLVDTLFLRQRTNEVEKGTPRLLDVIARADSDDQFTCHPLFEPAVFRAERPRRKTGALIEFVREPVRCQFSPFVDLDMLAKALLTSNVHRKNALLIYLYKPPGCDINPSFFSLWYAQEYSRMVKDMPCQRDLLSDFILIGCRKGYFPNPFLRRDCQQRSKGYLPMAGTDLLEAIKVVKNQRSKAKVGS